MKKMTHVLGMAAALMLSGELFATSPLTPTIAGKNISEVFIPGADFVPKQLVMSVSVPEKIEQRWFQRYILRTLNALNSIYEQDAVKVPLKLVGEMDGTFRKTLRSNDPNNLVRFNQQSFSRGKTPIFACDFGFCLKATKFNPRFVDDQQNENSNLYWDAKHEEWRDIEASDIVAHDIGARRLRRSAYARGEYGGNFLATPIMPGTGGKNILILGNTVHPSGSTVKFFNKRGYENRIAYVDVGPLEVGHVDEMFSTITLENDPCGFALVKANPILGSNLMRRSTDPVDYDLKFQKKMNKLINENVKIIRQVAEQSSPSCKQLKVIGLPVLYKNKRAELKKSLASMDQNDPEQMMMAAMMMMMNGGMHGMMMGMNAVDPNKIPDGVVSSVLSNSVNAVVIGKNFLTPATGYPLFDKNIADKLKKYGQNPIFIDTELLNYLDGGIHCSINVARDTEVLYKDAAFEQEVANANGTDEKLVNGKRLKKLSFMKDQSTDLSKLYDEYEESADFYIENDVDFIEWNPTPTVEIIDPLSQPVVKLWEASN